MSDGKTNQTEINLGYYEMANSLDVEKSNDREPTTAEILAKAKGLIDEPRKWYRGSRNYPQGDDTFTCLSITGAIGVAQGLHVSEYGTSEADKAMGQTVQSLFGPFGSADRVNRDDRTTHDAVMRLFDVAIKMAEELGDKGAD